MQPKSAAQPVRTTLLIGVLAIALVGFLNYQAVLDQYALKTYQPSTYVSQFEAGIGLTDKARAIFYRADPKLDAKADFNRDCDTQPHELELGCYYHGGIYVLKIDDSSLAPETDVVTAHELLHAAWTRLSKHEQTVLGIELRRIYDASADDDLKERMAGYAKSEPGEELNELHSILATEYATLSPALETHYKEYFTDRSKIVAAHMRYQNVFSSRRQDLERELADIRTKKGQLSVLNRQMEGYRSSGQIDSYNALVTKQNRMVDDINRQIAVYRQGVDEYNALSKSLDSQQITDTETPAQ